MEKSEQYLLATFGEGLLTDDLVGDLEISQNLFPDDLSGEAKAERVQPGVPVGWNAKRTVSYNIFNGFLLSFQYINDFLGCRNENCLRKNNP